MIWSGSRLNLWQSPHIHLFGGFSFGRVNFVNPLQDIWQMFVRIDIPRIVNTFLSPDVQISMSGPCNINVFQWTGECFLLRHVGLNPKFIVKTIDEVTLDRPEVGTGFSVICWFCRLRLSRFALNFSTEIFTPYKLFHPQRGYSEFAVSSWQFCCAICNLEYEFIIFLSDQYFLRVDSSRKFWCIQLFQIFQVSYSNISFPNSLRDQLTPRKNYWKHFLLPNWWILDWSFVEVGWYSTIAPKGIICPPNGCPNRLSYGIFPSAKRSWTFRR